MSVSQHPEGAVQGGLLTIQPQVKLTDPYGNEVLTGLDNLVITVYAVPGEGCNGTGCGSVCDGSEGDGKCFKLYPDTLDFMSAQQVCSEWGGSLASIDTPAHNQNAYLLTGGNRAWIGLSGTDGQSWRWQDGTAEVSTSLTSDGYSNWAESFSGDPGCVTMNTDFVEDRSFWGVEECSASLPFICSKPMGQNPTEFCLCCQIVMGTTSVLPTNGYGVFTDLYLYSDAGSGLRFQFVAHPPGETLPLFFASMALSNTFEVFSRTAQLRVAVEPKDGTALQALLTQPVVHLLDSAGRLVSRELLTVHCSLVWPFQEAGPLLIGRTSVQSVNGVVVFTDVGLTLSDDPSYVLQFEAVGGPVGQASTFMTQSMPFNVIQVAASLNFSTDTIFDQQMIAGHPLRPVTVRMFDALDMLVQNSNIDIEVVRVIFADTTRDSAEVVGGTRNVLCRDGVAVFTNVSMQRVTDSSGSGLRIVFAVPSLGLELVSPYFHVSSAAYSQLAFAVQPPNTTAGVLLNANGPMLVRLEDRF
eukprot:451554-Rhodomonas_salina.1